jgi:hypothetical protein
MYVFIFLIHPETIMTASHTFKQQNDFYFFMLSSLVVEISLLREISAIIGVRTLTPSIYNAISPPTELSSFDKEHNDCLLYLVILCPNKL